MKTITKIKTTWIIYTKLYMKMTSSMKTNSIRANQAKSTKPNIPNWTKHAKANLQKKKKKNIQKPNWQAQKVS